MYPYSSKRGGSKPLKSSPTQLSPTAQYCKKKKESYHHQILYAASVRALTEYILLL